MVIHKYWILIWFVNISAFVCGFFGTGLKPLDPQMHFFSTEIVCMCSICICPPPYSPFSRPRWDVLLFRHHMNASLYQFLNKYVVNMRLVCLFTEGETSLGRQIHFSSHYHQYIGFSALQLIVHYYATRSLHLHHEGLLVFLGLLLN